METLVSDHYNASDLTQKLKKALTAAQKDIQNLNLRDLAVIDQLHTGGIKSSIATIENADIKPGSHVLDAGCGIGGTSRLLAGQFNCRVTGIDIAEQFIDAAGFLTRAAGLDGSIRFEQGSIMDMPFEDQTFDAILCQHILMNIEDKKKAAVQFYRLLKPGGKLVLNEITKGCGNDMKYPVPWAASADISFLEPWEKMAPVLESAGFSMVSFSDESKSAVKWWERAKKAVAKRTGPPPPLNPTVIFGGNANFFGTHMHHNLETNTICLIEAVLKKR